MSKLKFHFAEGGAWLISSSHNSLGAAGVSENRPVVDHAAVVGENLKPLLLVTTLPESGHPPFIRAEYEKGVCAFLEAVKNEEYKKEKADINALAKLIAGKKG